MVSTSGAGTANRMLLSSICRVEKWQLGNILFGDTMRFPDNEIEE